ncbi:transglutaminase domain-containing protein [uncultured Ruminococcus sp.]|uniref:transglutaminase family protein n=1 Tax=uncultured Ruminococcus sp. TaxID=165186 RepID=UPI0025F7F05F|nr:transglutaminase domain-containing protein [uncultured Ruminococcus sp.]
MNVKTTQIKSSLVNILSKYALPLLLGTVVMNMIFKTYLTENVRLFTFGYVVYECLLFALFEWLKPRKIARGLVYTALMVSVLFLSLQLLRAGYKNSGKSFINWFYVNRQEIGQIDEYFYFLFVGLGFFITSVLYYFTIVRYRSFGTMLVLLFPFFIYGKRADSMGTLDITIMLTVFIALMVHSRLVSDESKGNLVINGSYVAAAAVFVTLVGALAMLMPASESKSYLEQNSNFFDLTIKTSGTYDSLSEESSPRFGADATGEILFNFTTTSDEKVIYLRRQSFDLFRDEKWTNDNSFYNFDFDRNVHLYGDNEVNSPSYVYSIAKSLADKDYSKDSGVDKAMFPDDLFSEKAVMNQFSDSFAPSYIPAPLMITPGENNVYIKTTHGEVYRPYDTAGNNLGISFEYYPETERERKVAANLDMTEDDFKLLLRHGSENGDITLTQMNNIVKVYALYTDVSAYDDKGGRMEALAKNITENCKNDYEKAQALVDYFEQNGYVYDNEYEPDDESIAYFLFTSKRGNCTNYATSMTLMARMLGLPARYVEGFAAYEKNERGEFVVRDSHAHAFVEVFVAGIGWMTFDPTVPGYQRDYSANGTNFDVSTFVSYFSRIALFIGVAFVLVVFVFLNRIIEVFFRLSLKFRDNGDKVIRLYQRVVKMLTITSHDKLSGYTPEMIREYLMEKRGAELGSLIDLFEKTCFGGYIPEDGEWKTVYAEYKSQWKKLAKREKTSLELDENI